VSGAPPSNLVRALVEALWSGAHRWVPVPRWERDPGGLGLVDQGRMPQTPVRAARRGLSGSAAHLVAWQLRRFLGVDEVSLVWRRMLPERPPALLAHGACATDAWVDPVAVWGAPARQATPGSVWLVVRGAGLDAPVRVEVPGLRAADAPFAETIDLHVGDALRPWPGPGASPAAGFADDLGYHLTDRRLLVHTLDALRRREWVQQAEAVRREVYALAVRMRREDLPRLDDTWALADWLAELAVARPVAGVDVRPLAEALERLTLSFHNAVFGVGWRRRDVHLHAETQAGEDGVQTTHLVGEALERAAEALGRGGAGARRIGRVRAATAPLAHVDARAEAPALPPPGIEGSAAAELGPLLACWTARQERLRHAGAEAAGEGQLERRTHVALGRWLGRWSAAGARRAPETRTFVLLWFVHRLLGQAADNPDLDGRSLDLAFAVRELLRRALFAAHGAYREATTDVLEALGRLVAGHAVRELGLPAELELESHLAEIGRPREGDGPDDALLHLQHVIEVYCGGLALLSHRGAEGGRGSLAHRLLGVDARNRKAPAALRRAVGLAALFHDAGMLVWSGGAGPARPDGDALATWQAAREAAERDLLQHCSDALEAKGVADRGVDADLDAQLRLLHERGEAHHAVTGAWMLDRRLQGCSGLDPDVARSALRAVLLHSLPRTRIRAAQDPAAAVIVLCDELFDWEPVLPARADVRDPGGGRLGAHRPGRYRSLQVPLAFVDGHLVAADGEGVWTVEARLPPPTAHGSPPFHTWLTVAQDLARIDWGDQAGFVPEVRIVSPRLVVGARRVSVYKVLRKALLGDASTPGAEPLRRWLDAAHDAEASEARGEDVLVVRPLTDRVYKDDVRVLFPAVDARYRAALGQVR
jgi:hypothetical protein